MRLCVALLLTIFMFGQSQPPAPTPRPAAHADKTKSSREENKPADNNEATKQLTSAINQLSTEIADRNQQQLATQREHKPSPDWWSRVSTILITLFTCALAVLAYLQWQAMHRQANITDRQAGIAEKQTDIAAKQLEITKAAEARHDTEKMQEAIEGIRERTRSDERYTEQLELAKENTATAKQTAIAANKNATYLINSERAWVIVKMERTAKETFMLSLRNCGRTPARISVVKQLETFTPPSDKLVLERDFRYDSPLKFMHPPMLVPRQKWDWAEDITNLPSVLPSDTYREVISHKKRYWLYGKVEYIDTVTFDNHETRFCFFYSASADMMFIGGPVGANDYT